jgi:hypothetical protein
MAQEWRKDKIMRDRVELWMWNKHRPLGFVLMYGNLIVAALVLAPPHPDWFALTNIACAGFIFWKLQRRMVVTQQDCLTEIALARQLLDYVPASKETYELLQNLNELEVRVRNGEIPSQEDEQEAAAGDCEGVGYVPHGISLLAKEAGRDARRLP